MANSLKNLTKSDYLQGKRRLVGFNPLVRRFKVDRALNMLLHAKFLSRFGQVCEANSLAKSVLDQKYIATVTTE